MLYCPISYLLSWRFVVHGCIDGYSLAVVYLKCNTNNTSDTVLSLFEGAVSEWGGDMGVENRQVAYYMLNHTARGPGRGSYITGRSVQNSRIERLWRDVYQLVLSSFYDLFLSLEGCGQLDPDNEEQLLCLHYTYLPIINEVLSKFVLSWNNHKIRTAFHARDATNCRGEWYRGIRILWKPQSGKRNNIYYILMTDRSPIIYNATT